MGGGFSKNIFLNIFLTSFLSGIFLNNIFGNYVLSLLSLAFLLVFLINLIMYLGNYKSYIVCLFVIILSFFFGVLTSNHNLNIIEKNRDFLKAYDSGFNHNLTFEIRDVYKIKTYEIEFLAKLKNINGLDLDVEKNILSIVKIAKNYEIEKGDIITSRARVELIKNFNDFDYKNFLLSKNIYFRSYLPFIERTGKINPSFILQYIANVRQKSLDIIYGMYPKNEAIFLAGILLGARESLPEDVKNNFNNSGLTHFIAVSGFNITILVIFFSFVFKFLPVFLRVIGITSVIVAFTFLVGDTAPVVRASIMGLIAYYIMMSGRKSANFTILLLTAFIMSLFSPLILNYDVSFALSFLAVLGILYTQNFWEKVFRFMPKIFAIKEAFVLTMAALVFTLPIMLFNFGQVSVLAPISNVLVTWTIPIAMLLGFLSVIFYLVFPLFGYLIGYFAWIFLKWDMLVVEFFGTKDFSVLKYDFGENSLYLQILYFVIIVFLVLFFRG